MSEPSRLVSVGIPTYNRADRLRSAVESVFAQDHLDVEVVISDNASTDGTEEYARSLVEQHPGRVRYLRNDENLGPIENYNRVRAACTGAFVMWLGDDDQLSPSYISTCLAVLDRRPEVAHVAGLVRYVDGDRDVREGEVIVCDQTAGPSRVVAYYRQVGDNGSFYGVTRGSVASDLVAMRHRMGMDWFLMAETAFLGGMVSAPEAVLTRSVGGATRSLGHVARTLGFTWFEGELPQLAIAWSAFREIGWASPVYRELGAVRRVTLGLHVAGIVVRRFVIPSIPKYLRLLGRRVRRRPDPR